MAQRQLLDNTIKKKNKYDKKKTRELAEKATQRGRDSAENNPAAEKPRQQKIGAK